MSSFPYYLPIVLVLFHLFCAFSLVKSQDEEIAETTAEAVVPCKIPPIPNGFLRLSRGNTALVVGRTVSSGTFVQIVCRSGYALSEESGASSTVCQESGQFMAEFKRCEEIQTNLTQCGLPSASARILGGAFAATGQFPWMTKLEIYFDGQRKPSICGASLIAKNWLLTAAHCLTSSGDVVVVTALLGRTNFSSEAEASNEQKLNTRLFYIHPNYKGREDWYQYDFALIKLNPSPFLSDLVRPICLPDEKAFCDNSTARNNAKVDGCVEMTAAGWGMTENGSQVSPSLKMINLTVTSRSSCERVGGYGNVSSVQFCAGRADPAQDTCLGDSGGPLMCQRTGVSSKVVVGVVSYGRSCGETDMPGVYGRVCKALPWIKSVINGATTIGAITASTTVQIESSQIQTVKQKSTTRKSPRIATTRKSSMCTVPTISNGYFTKADDSAGADTDQVIDTEGANVSPGQSVFLHCQDGFAMPSSSDDTVITSKSSTCSQSSQWSPKIEPSWCSRVVTCGPASLPKIRNGSFPDNGANNFGDSRQLQCNPGFRLSGTGQELPTITTCQANGLWLPLQQSVNCLLIVCAKLPSSINVTIGPGVSSFGSVRNVTCPRGFQLQAGTPSTISCQSNGNWTQPGRCISVVVTCSSAALPTLTNGVYTDSTTSTTYQVGTNLHLACNSGFRLASGNDVLTIQCETTGYWSLLSSYCQAVTCPLSTLSAILPAHSQCNDDYDSDTTEFNVGSNRRIVCVSGYQFSNRATSISTTCQSNAQWAPISVSCQIIKCLFASLPYVSNGNWQQNGGENDYAIGSSVLLSCNSGYIQSDSSASSVSCKPDGSWSSFSGQCSRRTTTTSSTIRTTRGPSPIVNLPCSQDYVFKCNNGINISCWYVCDGDNQCGDGSDESICTQTMKNQYWLDLSLMNSAQNGSLELARLLLDKGANLEARNSAGRTVLFLAVVNSHFNVTRLLIDRGASIDAKSDNNYTALHFAICNSLSLELVRLLLDRGANVNYILYDGGGSRTPLIHAITDQNNLDLVKLLVDRGANVNIRTNYDDCPSSTALQCATTKGRQGIVDYLKSIGAS